MTPFAREPVDKRAWTRVAPWAGGHAWQLGDICVLSTLDMAKLPQSELVGPQWHISISRVASGGQKRASDLQVRKAVRAFRMGDAEEDNHHPGVARHFFLPVEPAARVGCECKDDEITIVEADGYRWQNDPSACRGCEHAHRFGTVCGIHSK